MLLVFHAFKGGMLVAWRVFLVGLWFATLFVVFGLEWLYLRGLRVLVV